MDRKYSVHVTPEQLRAINNLISIADAHHSGAFKDDVAVVNEWIATEVQKIKK